MTEPEFTTEELENEEWRPIPEYPEYAASTLGRIRRETQSRCNTQGRILKARPTSVGYPGVSLVQAGRVAAKTVHRLVAATWLPLPTESQRVVNHKNGIKTDNRVSNLEWCTYAENVRHAIDVLGHVNDDANAHRAKFSPETIVAIHNAMMDGRSVLEILTTFNISETQYYRIRNRVCWKKTLAGLPTNYPPQERYSRGSRNVTSKLNEEKVRDIKALFAQGMVNSAIAARYGVRQGTIDWIRKGVTWRHVT